MRQVKITLGGKFIIARTFDGRVTLYESLTGIVWRTDRYAGNHNGVALALHGAVFEFAAEGREEDLAAVLNIEFSPHAVKKEQQLRKERRRSNANRGRREAERANKKGKEVK